MGCVCIANERRALAEDRGISPEVTWPDEVGDRPLRERQPHLTRVPR